MTAIRNRIKELKMVPRKDLVPHPLNWRLHNSEQRGALDAVLKEIGIANAVIAYPIDGGKFQLIDGHLRSETIDQDIPTLVLDVDAEEAAKLLITLDPIAAMAETSKDHLASLLNSVEFQEDGTANMLRELGIKAGVFVMPEMADPEVPEAADVATTRKGDLWILGRHRLYCGDSGSPADLDTLLGGQPIHLANTDPPYNVKVEPRSNNAIAAGLSSFPGTSHHQSLDVARHPGKSKGNTKKMRAKDRPLANDFVTDEAFDGMLDAWFGNISRVLVPGRSFYIWGGYANCANYPPFLKKHELYFSQAIIWVKEHPVLTRKDFMGNHEWCFYGWKLGAGHEFFGPNNAADVWSVKKVNPQSMVHLTEKPVELAARAMMYSSKPGENVLDLFVAPAAR